MRKYLIQSFFVIALASASALTSAIPAQAASPKLGCGVYEVSGELRSKGSSTRGIEVYPKSRQQFLLVLRQLSLEDRLKFGDKPVRATVQIYVPGQGTDARARVLKPIERITQPEAIAHPFKLIEKKSCN
jgi:hypothetical protein